MKGRILGFQRLVWWPKWTPASSRSRIDTWFMVLLLMRNLLVFRLHHPSAPTPVNATSRTGAPGAFVRRRADLTPPLTQGFGVSKPRLTPGRPRILKRDYSVVAPCP